jgi:hypothetical protein
MRINLNKFIRGERSRYSRFDECALLFCGVVMVFHVSTQFKQRLNCAQLALVIQLAHPKTGCWWENAYYWCDDLPKD